MDDAIKFYAAGGQRIRPRKLLKAVSIGALLIGLAGCASAHVTPVASTNTGAPAPAEILVTVDAAPTTQNATLQKVETSLQLDLIARLTKAGISSEPLVPGTSHPGAAVLHVTVTEADPGNAAERLVLGFGLGSAKLTATADLYGTDNAAAQREMAFGTSSDSGFKPGLVLPGGVALATGNAIHLAIGGGIDLAANLRGGLARPVEKTANAVVDQLHDYYQFVGWSWPATA